MHASRSTLPPGVGFVVIVALASLMAALSAAPQSRDEGTSAAGTIRIDAVPVPFDPRDDEVTSIGNFAYAGGLVLTSPDTPRLHGLSDLKVRGTDRLLAVGDRGVVLEARLQFDRSGRLSGLTDARLTALVGLDGAPVEGTRRADAEGIAELANGDRLVSFEVNDRIWRYPADGGTPAPAPAPMVKFPPNGGMEALAAAPHVAADAYVVGAEISGETWICRLSSGCTRGPTIAKEEGFGLVAVAPLSRQRTAYLLRAADILRGFRTTLEIDDARGVVDRLQLALPLPVDNFEGLAAVPRPDGTFRFYLISDDNALAFQRTLLVAFDWRPPARRVTRPAAS